MKRRMTASSDARRARGAASKVGHGAASPATATAASSSRGQIEPAAERAMTPATTTAARAPDRSGGTSVVPYRASEFLRSGPSLRASGSSSSSSISRSGGGSDQRAPTRTGHVALSAHSYYLTRIAFLRALAGVALVAFLVAATQNAALIGARGITPVCRAFNGRLGQAAELYGFERPSNTVTADGATETAHSVHASAHASSHLPGGAGAGWKFYEIIGDPIVVALQPSMQWWLHNVAPRLAMFMSEPTLLVFTGCSDAWLLAFALAGAVLAAFVLLTGAANALILLGVYALYLSISHVGGTWYAFGWEMQLLETSFWAAFAVPVLSLDPFASPPPVFVAFAYRWLLFKIMLGAGLIKVRGDACWRDLTCMLYHYETQPNPSPASYWLHFAPPWFHRFETAVNHIVELAAPFLLFMPRPARLAGGAIQLAFQATLIVSGNLSFLNWLTMVPAVWCFDDACIAPLFSVRTQLRAAAADARDSLHCDSSRLYVDIARESGFASIRSRLVAVRKAAGGVRRLARTAMLAGVCGALIHLNVPVAHNLLSSNQAMNTGWSAFHLVNTYGAFGSIGRVRTEVVFSATSAPDASSLAASDAAWVEYEFKCKPGALSRRPCIITPWHYRLDWLAWFAAMGSYRHYPWTVRLADQLLTSGAASAPASSSAVPPWLARSFIARGVQDLIDIDPFAGTGVRPACEYALLYVSCML